MGLSSIFKKSSKKKTILIVDDKPAITEMLATSFTYSGLKTIQAHSGEEALKTITRERVDLVVTDVQMPGMSGVDLGREIRKTTKNIDTPIFFITGTGLSDKGLETIENKISKSKTYTKPLKITDLIADIRAKVNLN